MGWKEKFGLPTTMAKEAIGISSYNTYSKTLNDLVDWKFIILIEKSKNQYSSNIIALSNNDKALDKALDKAMIKHGTKQLHSTVLSTVQSNDSIIRPITNIHNTNLHSTEENGEAGQASHAPSVKKSLGEKRKVFYDMISPFLETYGKEMLNAFYLYWTEPNKSQSRLRWESEKFFDVKRRLETWDKRQKNQFNKPTTEIDERLRRKLNPPPPDENWVRIV